MTQEERFFHVIFLTTSASTLIVLQNTHYNTIIDNVISNSNFNGLVSIKQNNKLVFEKIYNKLDNSKINLQSQFAIGSISKQFSAIMILRLEEDKKLNIDENVSKYLEEFNNEKMKNIKIKQLLNHTSGISDNNETFTINANKEFNYSNQGYKFLGKIIEKISNKPFDDFANEFCIKYNLKNTNTPKFASNTFTGTYDGTLTKNKKVENVLAHISSNTIFTSAGGFLSTKDDLHLWNSLIYENKIL